MSETEQLKAWLKSKHNYIPDKDELPILLDLIGHINHNTCVDQIEYDMAFWDGKKVEVGRSDCPPHTKIRII